MLRPLPFAFLWQKEAEPQVTVHDFRGGAILFSWARTVCHFWQRSPDHLITDHGYLRGGVASMFWAATVRLSNDGARFADSRPHFFAWRSESLPPVVLLLFIPDLYPLKHSFNLTLRYMSDPSYVFLH